MNEREDQRGGWNVDVCLWKTFLQVIEGDCLFVFFN